MDASLAQPRGCCSCCGRGAGLQLLKPELPAVLGEPRIDGNLAALLVPTGVHVRGLIWERGHWLILDGMGAIHRVDLPEVGRRSG